MGLKKAALDQRLERVATIKLWFWEKAASFFYDGWCCDVVRMVVACHVLHSFHQFFHSITAFFCICNEGHGWFVDFGCPGQRWNNKLRRGTHHFFCGDRLNLPTTTRWRIILSLGPWLWSTNRGLGFELRKCLIFEGLLFVNMWCKLHFAIKYEVTLRKWRICFSRKMQEEFAATQAEMQRSWSSGCPDVS